MTELSSNFEGDKDVPLAVISGKDIRKKLPSELFKRKPKIFLLKFTFAMLLIIVSSAIYVVYREWYIACFSIVINGLIFAHLIELQHECMHGHAVKSVRLNRLFGFFSGIFMMSSHSHYRYDHLRHHAYLGTEKNLEHFDYRFDNLHSVLGFSKAFFDLSRYGRVFSIIICIFMFKPIPDVDKTNYTKKIKEEYFLYLILFLLSIAYTIISGDLLFVILWWAPALLIAEGVHFLIEMPEHYGLNTQTDPNVLGNTRTIKTNKIVHWFVNGNDLHTAHHYHHGIPMCNVKKLHDLMKDGIHVYEESYFEFYKSVVFGKIRNHTTGSVMTR